ncbi:MOSC N-terminal beta barrel domain-containing protein [Blastococcus litoris]|uniref:MOSC N-terminal beta barrel domain-containing protein n=1 Tax=Blastococcus litoris TaxID=2171622 RepID=UPI001F1463C5|nr:MOSC N-terminal beta barrel domain-containing protein [Blastococcus litoris]
MTAEQAVGRVAEIRIYPVRSLAGTAVDLAQAGPDGLDGDRVWTVVGEDGPVRAKDAPALASLTPAEADPATLSAALGRPVHLEQLPPQPGVAPVHLVSRAAVDRAAAGEVPEGCSADDPRANLLLDLDGDERAWVGRHLRIGEAVLQLTRRPKHCLGVYADVLTPGVVRTGDPVVLV